MSGRRVANPGRSLELWCSVVEPHTQPLIESLFLGSLHPLSRCSTDVMSCARRVKAALLGLLLWRAISWSHPFRTNYLWTQSELAFVNVLSGVEVLAL